GHGGGAARAGGSVDHRVPPRPLGGSRSASEPPNTPAPTTIALCKRDRFGAAVVEPPGRELARVRAEDQPRARRPEAGTLEIGARRSRRRARVRVEDCEFVALVLEEPDLGVDLEPKSVRRRVRVPRPLAATRPAGAA